MACWEDAPDSWRKRRLRVPATLGLCVETTVVAVIGSEATIVQPIPDLSVLLFAMLPLPACGRGASGAAKRRRRFVPLVLPLVTNRMSSSSSLVSESTKNDSGSRDDVALALAVVAAAGTTTRWEEADA